MIYIREAHPTDGWDVPEDNKPYGVEYSTAKSLQERQKAANQLKSGLCPNSSVLIDGLDDALECAYECRPERFYVLNSSSKTIAYQSFAVF